MSPKEYPMAIDYSDYEPTDRPRLHKHKKDATKYLFDVKVEGKRFRKTYKGLATHTDRDRLDKAYDAMREFIVTKTKELGLTVSISSTIDDYYKKLSESKYIKVDAEFCKEYRETHKKFIDKTDEEIESHINTSSGWSKRHRNEKDWFYEKHIKAVLGNKIIVDLKGSDFTRLNGTMKTLSTRSQKSAYEILVPIMKLAIEDDLISVSPIKASHIPKRNSLTEKKIINDAETKYRLTYKAINTVFAKNPHHRAIFLFGFHGRRMNEVLSMKWEDIDFTNARYIVRGENSKVNQDMQFKLPQDVTTALSEFRGNNGRVFTINHLEFLYDSIRKESGIQEFTFHWMRNLAVSALSSMGVEATHLSAMLGHTDAGTLRKYLSLQREQSTSATLSASQMLLEGGAKK